MAFIDFHFFSESLGQSCAAYVLIPQKTTGQIGLAGGETREKYPTLYLLHGLSDDHTIWMRRTSIERYAAARNIAVVMPAAARSFYQDMASGPKYWTFLSEELPALCEQFFPLSPARADNFAAGLSMGGYGALRLALGKPEKFAAGASLSGALDLPRRAKEAGRTGSRIEKAEWVGIVGPELAIEGTDADLHFLAQKVAVTAKPKPKIYLACGTEDDLLPDSLAFRQHLDSLHLPVAYEEYPGGHEWGFWDERIQRVLDWLPVRN